MDPIDVKIDVSDEHLIDVDKLNNIIEQFNIEQDVFKAFVDMQISICQATNKPEPSIDDTIYVYYQIAGIGINNPHFVFKLLTTCEGINANEQDKFLNITYLKTSILTMMDSFIE
jgi:hypothetical protein